MPLKGGWEVLHWPSGICRLSRALAGLARRSSGGRCSSGSMALVSGGLHGLQASSGPASGALPSCRAWRSSPWSRPAPAPHSLAVWRSGAWFGVCLLVQRPSAGLVCLGLRSRATSRWRGRTCWLPGPGWVQQPPPLAEKIPVNRPPSLLETGLGLGRSTSWVAGAMLTAPLDCCISPWAMS